MTQNRRDWSLRLARPDDADFMPQIERAASVYPNNLAVVHGDRRYTWTETFERCRRLASALSKRGIGLGDTVEVRITRVDIEEARVDLQLADELPAGRRGTRRGPRSARGKKQRQRR